MPRLSWRQQVATAITYRHSNSDLPVHCQNFYHVCIKLHGEPNKPDTHILINNSWCGFGLFHRGFVRSTIRLLQKYIRCVVPPSKGSSHVSNFRFQGLKLSYISCLYLAEVILSTSILLISNNISSMRRQLCYVDQLVVLATHTKIVPF